MRQKLARAAGIPVLTARALSGGGDVDPAVTALGANSQANSYGIKATLTVVTVGGAGTGVRVPADMEVGDEIYIFNSATGAAINVYPPVGGNISNAGLNAAVALGNNLTGHVMCFAPNVFILK